MRLEVRGEGLEVRGEEGPIILNILIPPIIPTPPQISIQKSLS